MTPSIYALLAAASYADIRLGDYKSESSGVPPIDSANDSPLPVGWRIIAELRGSGVAAPLSAAGFTALAIQGPNGEVAISYAGTEFGAFNIIGIGFAQDMLLGNLPLAFGRLSPQLALAAAFYQQVREQNPEAAITFTGHSLGGGIASIMAAYTGETAYTFAPAPFARSADSTQAEIDQADPDSLLNSIVKFSNEVPLLNSTLQAPYVRFLLSRSGALSGVRTYLSSVAGGVLRSIETYDPAVDFLENSVRVSATAIKGELLERLFIDTGAFSAIEKDPRTALLANNPVSIGIFDRHSIDLHAALLLQPSLEAHLAQVKDAVELMFDSKLYGMGLTGAQGQAFIADLLRNHVGITDERTGMALRSANGMLNFFDADLARLIPLADAQVSGGNRAQLAQMALTALMIEWYKNQPDNYAGGTFFSGSGPQLQFTPYADAHRADAYLNPWLESLVPARAGSAIVVPARDAQWTVTTGEGASGAALDATRHQVFIGAGGSDSFTGGERDDLMIGGDGADTLEGGGGNDRLAGGGGDDTYVFARKFGIDTLRDASALH